MLGPRLGRGVPLGSRLCRSSGIVAATVLLLYVTWFAVEIAPNDPTRSALIGETFLDAGAGNSDAIDGLRGHGNEGRRDIATLSTGPVLALKAFLALSVSGEPTPGAVYFEVVPFRGLASRSPFGHYEVAQVLAIVIPSLLALVLVVLSVRGLSVGILALALNVLLFVVLLPRASYEHVLTSSRIALGVPLAFVFCLPLVDGPRRRLLVAVAPTALWMLAWLAMDV